ncbi:protein kinase domain-containing protein [Mycobacterium numidiamassiliense]|uniref:protein kinase domain-containing protein n=1 Tax=Mycobacterium numidiamassiliense TaxID=1841861 RepID=UPI00097D35D9|nr:protein kinase [Mycobacterium numidiamassiliense]
MPKLFVSYARQNQRALNELVDHLNLLGFETWVDPSRWGGQNWWDAILRQIAECDTFIAVISRDALSSETCKREFDWAQALGKPVLSVAVEPPDAAVLQRISIRRIVDYSNPKQRGASTLAGSLSALPQAPSPPPAPLPVPPEAPLGYLTELVDQVSSPEPLTENWQREINQQLQAALRSVDSEERQAACEVLDVFKSRHDLHVDIPNIATQLPRTPTARPEHPVSDAAAVAASTLTEPQAATDGAGLRGFDGHVTVSPAGGLTIGRTPETEAVVSSLSAELAMTMIGDDYRYVGELGAGGGGTVVLARHVPMDRLVAVKAVTGSSRSEIARLRREGRVLAALHHPSILNIFRLFEHDHVIALITEYLEGGNFDDALDGERLSGRAVADVLLQVGSALRAAHAAGIVHRDVKPTNVLLAKEKRAVLADFGLSRLGGEFRTATGTITGTPLYMSPEQITAPNVEAPTLDVYSYGAMVYRALTGQPPFCATDLKTLADLHLRALPLPLDQLRTGVPRAVSAAVLGMLAKNPSDRPTLKEVDAALRAVEPQQWDALLPQAEATATVGEWTGGGAESASFPNTPILSPGKAKRAITTLEQPVFRPKRTPRYGILAVAAGILAGLALGLIILLII